ncbi:MAG: peptidase M36, partial [Gammaproteobacteria bacterium]|nr:peptidase M36 [Gammaproteobacteria bacterium]
MAGGVADGSANIVTPTTNQPPVANAGIDQRASFGTGPVTLDGSTSSGTEGVTLTYAWVITTAPTGSTAMLSGAASAKPSFTPDKTGLYIFQLTVSDGLASATDEVELDVAANGVPIAKAGPDQDVGFGAQVTFDGSASSDPEHRPLTYTWIQVPGYGPDVTGGSGSLTGVTVNFTAPPTAATVLFDLRVNDGLGDSFADRVQVYVLKNPS